ncbi:hypothetical protein [Actinomadura luteofluorescens]|uniref:hypothetical protein n=1 Tax=Actinomadura luteofluorescens TaxID=46163 RepID=UPI003D91E9AB
MQYETAAHAEQISLNIKDLGTKFRRARVTSKGGAIEYVPWATSTARLLPRLLKDRTTGTAIDLHSALRVQPRRATPEPIDHHSA